MEKAEESVSDLDSRYSDLKKDVEKLKIDHSNVLKQSEFEEMKKNSDKKFKIVEDELASVDEVREENVRLSELIEDTLLIVKKNQKDIEDIAITIGDDHIKRVSDYEAQLAAILRIIDTLAGQISELKKKAGVKKSSLAINVENKKKNPVDGKKIKLQNMNIHPEISKQLIADKPKLSGIVKEMQDGN